MAKMKGIWSLLALIVLISVVAGCLGTIPIETGEISATPLIEEPDNKLIDAEQTATGEISATPLPEKTGGGENININNENLDDFREVLGISALQTNLTQCEKAREGSFRMLSWPGSSFQQPYKNELFSLKDGVVIYLYSNETMNIAVIVPTTTFFPDTTDPYREQDPGLIRFVVVRVYEEIELGQVVNICGYLRSTHCVAESKDGIGTLSFSFLYLEALIVTKKTDGNGKNMIFCSSIIEETNQYLCEMYSSYRLECL